MESTLLSTFSQFSQLSLNSTPEFMLMPAKQKSFFSISTSSQEHDIDMLHEGQENMMDINSPHDIVVNRYEEVTEGEDENENYEDEANDLYVSPSNFETTVNDPYFATFVRELYENNGYGSPVASFQKICYFNGADSYAIPHHGNHIQPASQNIAHILEWWLTEKLSHTGETIPILEESPQISAESIMSKLRETSALNGLAKVLINIRAGHIYLLHMIGDEIVMAQNCERFFQQFPLFVNVSIKVQEHSPSVRHNTCQVLVAVEHVTMKDQTISSNIKGSENRNNIPAPCKFSQQHHQTFDGTFTNTRVTSSPDGQTFCLLEEVATNADVIGNGGGYLSGGGFTGGIVVMP